MTKTCRVALITGAAKGIGACIARRLAEQGYSVAINYATSVDPAHALVAELRAQGAVAGAFRADVSEPAEVARMFEAIESALGTVDVLVNNAGIMKTVHIAEAEDADFARQFAINTQGVFNTLREAARRLNDGGRIINLSSTAVALDLPGYALYNGSKAAVEAFTRVFARELRGRRITVNAVAPGPVATALFMAGKSVDQIEQFTAMSPLQRLGQPDDIAAVVAFLAGPDGAWVNAQVLRANGGVA